MTAVHNVANLNLYSKLHRFGSLINIKPSAFRISFAVLGKGYKFALLRGVLGTNKLICPKKNIR